VKHAVGLHPERQRLSAMTAFMEIRTEAEAVQRQAEIDALPAVEWKGKPLRSLRCNGISGKGPHVCNVPESMLWALIDLRSYLCPHHQQDRWAASGQV
jgi:hypothetical protein